VGLPRQRDTRLELAPHHHYSSPAVTATGLAYLDDHHGYVHTFDSAPKLQVASYYVGSEIWSAPVIDQDYDLYIAAQDGHVHGLTPRGRSCFNWTWEAGSIPIRH